MTLLACCFCGGGIEDVLHAEITAKWNDSFDSQTWYAHDGCLRVSLLKAFHHDVRQLEIRGPSGASIVASYLEEGHGEEWRRIALKVGFEQPADDYPQAGTPEDLLDRRIVSEREGPLAGAPSQSAPGPLGASQRVARPGSVKWRRPLDTRPWRTAFTLRVDDTTSFCDIPARWPRWRASHLTRQSPVSPLERSRVRFRPGL